jgi:predicted phosphoribosyltransferase
MRSVCDEVVVLDAPPWFFSIGNAYVDFAQVSDDDVVSVMDQAAARSAPFPMAAGRA